MATTSTGNKFKTLVKLGRVVHEICVQTGRPTCLSQYSAPY